MSTVWPKLRVRVPDGGKTILTTVELDGKPLPALRVAFDTGDVREKGTGLVAVTVTFYADLDLEVWGGQEVVTKLQPVKP